MAECQSCDVSQLKFPLQTDLRVIMDQSLSFLQAREAIETACKTVRVPVQWGGEHQSAKGTYTSYVIHVNFESHEKMLSLFEQLKQLPGIKTIL